MTLRRRDLLRAALATPVLAACTGDKKKNPKPGSGPVALQDVGAGAALTLQIGDAEAEVLQRTARYAFGLTTPDGTLSGAKATVYVGKDPAQPATATVAAAELNDAGLTGRGLYVANVPFPTAGDYLVAIVAETPNGTFRGGTRVIVAEKSPSPVPGQKAPSVKTPTTKDPAGAKPLCSRRPDPCAMHDVSLDAALKNGKPTVVVFAAPAFCQTELCGPDVEIVQGVATKHAGKANFIHVEAYVGAKSAADVGALAPPLKAFKFETEPWLYLIDKGGVVSDRISGAFAASEVEERLAKLL